MKTPLKKTLHKFLAFVVILLITSLSLAACGSAMPESDPDTAEDQLTKILIPIVGSDAQENTQIGSEDKAYPDTVQETRNSDIAEPVPDQAYPEPVMEKQAQAAVDDLQAEPYPDPQKQPVQEIKPTPRGNQLVATNPSTLNLMSGNLQLVEFFAFW